METTPQPGTLNRILSFNRSYEVGTKDLEHECPPAHFSTNLAMGKNDPRPQGNLPNFQAPNNAIPPNMAVHPAPTARFQQTKIRVTNNIPHNFANPSPVRVDPKIITDVEALQSYIKKTNAELRRIHAIIHIATSSTPYIDRVIEETRCTPFKNRIGSIRLHDIGKF